jgi:hypothetical protein
MYWSDVIVKQEQRKDLLRQIEDRQLVRQALAARPRGARQGYELTRRYARYALSSLATVGFGIRLN